MGYARDLINELDPKEIPLDILETSLKPNGVEASCLFINNQPASDILKICDVETNDLVVYIPGYIPSFIESIDLELLIHWILFEIESPGKLTELASHFSHSIRMANDSKIDAFMYRDSTKDLHAFLSSDDGKQYKVPSQGDVFSFITERQKMRVSNDLHAFNTQSSIYDNYYSNYQSTNFAFFTTITAAIQYIPYLLPNIHDTVSHLKNLFPSPYITASEFMKKAVKDKLGLDIDPDQTFIRYSLHEAKITISDPMIPPAFGGQKASTTIQSLTEAALSNYREETSPYGYTTIIYQDLSGKREYRSSDQVLTILPKDLEEIIADADIDALHKNTLDAFWSTHADQTNYFIKYRFLQQTLESLPKKNSPEKSFENPPQKKFNSLSKQNLKTISEIVLNSLFLEEKTLPKAINPHLCLEAINIAGYSSTDMFLFRDKNQQEVILYIAGYSPPFFVFDNYETCICSLEEQAKEDSKWRELMSLHFSMDVQESVINALKLGPYIDGSSLATAPFPKPADCSFENVYVQHPITTKPLEGSLFKIIQKNIQERSYLDAETIITSDRELMLKRIISTAHFIEIALFVPSFGFPILNWIAFAALVTETMANLYIAKNGDTVEERHQAAVEAGMNSIGCILVAFFSTLSLKFSKNQHEILMQDPEELRPLTSGTGGSGIFSFSRKTPISEELFFDTTKSMKVWQIAVPDELFKNLDAKAWFLDEQFLLFTGGTNKAKHLIISSHGGYLPRSSIVQVPPNTELVVLGPHGWQLVDPETIKIAKGLILPYGIINETTAFPTQTAFYPSLFSRSANTHVHPRRTSLKLLAGTDKPGYIRNYTLSKYQKFGVGEESYLDIAQTIHHSRHPYPNIYKIGFQPVDILTIRNRRGKILPTLADVFKSLKSNDIHYDRITLEFCRSKMPLSASTPALKYIPAKKFSL
ncbi:MAG: dermonecrotic toxin domain-containing protein [Candidatus Rhabdochlamydia sp.]